MRSFIAARPRASCRSWCSKVCARDVIVLDPPRKGADEAVLRAIAVAQPARVVYISCNPATQARDARILCAMGYAAQRCQPVDMFCQTAGVENVMLFERQQAAEQP